VLFDKYRALETARRGRITTDAESRRLSDLTPAQAAAFETVVAELEAYGFEVDETFGTHRGDSRPPLRNLPASEARNVLAEVLDTVDSEKRGAARATLRDEIAASLACPRGH